MVSFVGVGDFCFRALGTAFVAASANFVHGVWLGESCCFALVC